MDAIERLSKRLQDLPLGEPLALSWEESDYLARWFYEIYLPEQLLGMKEAAAYMGLLHFETREPNSNALTMRLARGHGPLIVKEIAKNRLTTKDACDAYLEKHPPRPMTRDDVSQEAS